MTALLLTPSTPFQQLILRDERAISAQTPANHTSSVFQLTNLPAAPSNIEHLRPVAIVDPLYMHQTPSDNQSTSSEEIVDGNTSFFNRERERYHEKLQDPEKRKLKNQRERKRRIDPEKRKLKNQRQRERYHEEVQDPEKRKMINQRHRERRADPEKRKLLNQRQRERYHEKVQDPEKRKLINQRQRERYHEKVQDPEKRKLINQRQQALPAISPSGAISQLSHITEPTPTSSTN